MKQEKNEVAANVAVAEIPKGLLVLYYGTTELTDKVEQIQAIRGYIRSKVLKQYSIASVDTQNFATLGIAFNKNKVVTNLKLPKVLTNAQGIYTEPLPTYYQRVLPDIKKWFNNALFNSGIGLEMIDNIL